jgi:two-component system, NarL family, invasion response regulator UvrY
MTRVLVADDHPIVRKGIEWIIVDSPTLTLAASCGNGREALQIIRAGGCDLAVLDIGMPQMSGLEVLEAVRTESLPVPIIILSMYEEETFALRAMKMGASAYVTKKHASEELVAAIEKVSKGGRYVTASFAESMVQIVSSAPKPDALATLSERELNVLMRLARGERLKQIADAMFLSPKTVTTYRARILEKLGLENNIELARFAAAQGLVEPSGQ